MENFFVLIGIGIVIGTLGTLIGAGGGFILVPLLILLHPHYSPELISAISMAVLACNAISGSGAYIVARRVDYKAGLTFAACTIPGSILGVITTKYIPRNVFDIVFGVMLIVLSVYLFLRSGTKINSFNPKQIGKGMVHRQLTDRQGESYSYSYNIIYGAIVSIFVGYFSPLLGIGGGIIHVPVMVQWLGFPVHIATATSHFILAIMASVSVIVHIIDGSYNSAVILRMVAALCIGVIPGAQLGAFLSRKVHGAIIIKALAAALGLVGVRILLLRLGIV